MSAQARSPRKSSSTAQKSLFEQTTLFEFSRVINSSLDLNFILSHALFTIMGRILSSKAMAVLQTGESSYTVEMVKGFPSAVNGAVVEIIGLHKDAVNVDEIDDSRFPWVGFFRRHGVSLLLPLFMGEKLIGVLAFGPRLARKRLLKKEETYLRSLANLSAAAIEKTHMIDELQAVNRRLDRKIQELNTLFELGKEFGILLDPDKLVRLLVFSLLGQIGVNRYLICLKEGPDMKVLASRVNGSVPQGELLSGLTVQRTPVSIEDIPVRGKTDPRDPLLEIGLTALVPMQLQGETKGLVLLGPKLSREPFTKDDLEFLSSLGNLAIISLENARLFNEAIEKQRLEDELMIAREIQKGLLPSVLPQIPGIELAATNISSKQVGGDYYDVIHCDGSRYFLAIGDVSGKGSPAALLMANLQATIRALVPLQLPIEELTARVNDLMCENTGGSKFVTFFWGVVDHLTRSFNYVNAGHNYPYLMRRDGAFERLQRGGMILGVLKTTIPYEHEVVGLREGDTLVLFTDGVTEAMNNEGVEYGEERLEAVLRDTQNQEAHAIIERVYQDVLSYTSGAPQSDDLTMMVVRVGGVAEKFAQEREIS
ncbi:MAG: SpoIIE family protein phosphatase [Bacteroidota bacterium]